MLFIMGNDLYADILSILPRTQPPWIRDEICQNIAVDILSESVTLDTARLTMKDYIRQALINELGERNIIRLDNRLPNGNTIGSLLRDDYRFIGIAVSARSLDYVKRVKRGVRMNCIYCQSTTERRGKDSHGDEIYRCSACHKNFTNRSLVAKERQDKGIELLKQGNSIVGVSRITGAAEGTVVRWKKMLKTRASADSVAL